MYLQYLYLTETFWNKNSKNHCPFLYSFPPPSPHPTSNRKCKALSTMLSTMKVKWGSLGCFSQASLKTKQPFPCLEKKVMIKMSFYRKDYIVLSTSVKSRKGTSHRANGNHHTKRTACLHSFPKVYEMPTVWKAATQSMVYVANCVGRTSDVWESDEKRDEFTNSRLLLWREAGQQAEAREDAGTEQELDRCHAETVLQSGLIVPGNYGYCQICQETYGAMGREGSGEAGTWRNSPPTSHWHYQFHMLY